MNKIIQRLQQNTMAYRMPCIVFPLLINLRLTANTAIFYLAFGQPQTLNHALTYKSLTVTTRLALRTNCESSLKRKVAALCYYILHQPETKRPSLKMPRSLEEIFAETNLGISSHSVCSSWHAENEIHITDYRCFQKQLFLSHDSKNS